VADYAKFLFDAFSTPGDAIQKNRDYAAKLVAPMTRGGKERMAAQTLRDAATDPRAAAEALSSPGERGAGSKPTTFQQTGDMGLGALERR
jgi:hypothetical protein